MDDREYALFRRSALKLLSGAAVGTVGLGSASAASGETDSAHPTDEHGHSEYVLRLENPASITSNTDSVSVSTLKQSADDVQQGVLSTLEPMDGVQVRNQFWLTNAIVVAADEEHLDPTAELAALDNVSDVHPNFAVERIEPTDEEILSPLSDDSDVTYGLEHLNVSDVWDEFGARGEGTRVAVLDSGIDPEHPDIEFSDSNWASFDMNGDKRETEPNDPLGHGTHVSGTIVGGDESGQQIGVAPDAELLSVKVLDVDSTFATIIAGMEWAVENDADVINMSLGVGTYVDTLIEPVQNARDAGTLVIVSSGNSGADTSFTPANVYESVAVGMTDEDRTVDDLSSSERIYRDGVWDDPPEEWPEWYTVPNVSAPGVEVLSAVPGGGWMRQSGTSMAAPHVAGLCALALSADSSLEPADIESALEEQAITPDEAEDQTRYGTGIVNAFNTLTSIEHDGAITGTVQTEDDEPAVGVTIETGYGTTTRTDEDGQYHVPVPNGETTVGVSEFGFDSDEVTVSVDGETNQSLTAEEFVDVEQQTSHPSAIDASESIEFSIEVAHVEEYSVDLVGESDIDPGAVTVEIADESLTPGDSISFNEPLTEPDVPVTVTVGSSELEAYASSDGTVETGGLRAAIDDWREGFIETDQLRAVIDVWRSGEEIESGVDSESATLELRHTFAGPNGEAELTTDPVELVADPEPPTFEITSVTFDSEVGEERSLEFESIITNTGDVSDEQWVSFEVEYDGLFAWEESQIELDAGASETFEGSILFGDVPRGEGEQRITTQDDEEEASFDVLGPDIELTDEDTPEAVDAGDAVTFDLEFENDGDIDGSTPILFTFAQAQITERDVHVRVGQTKTESFEVKTEGLDPGVYEYGFVDPFASERILSGELEIVSEG